MSTVTGRPAPASIRPGSAAGPVGEARIDHSGVPVALTEAAERQRAAHKNADGTPRLVQVDGRQMDFGATGRAQLPAGSFGAELRRLRDGRDAGNATLVADNATLHRLTYTYGTHKAMEAWVTNVPADGKLLLNLICTPSSHAGSTSGDKQKNLEKFARENVYNLEVLYPDGTRELHKFDVRGNSPPEGPSEHPVFATPSPDIAIDVNKWAGKDVRIRGWADGSAGVDGYVEHRETILHL